MTQDGHAPFVTERALEPEDQLDAANPFAESSPVAGEEEPRSPDAPGRAEGFLPWTESLTPFSESFEVSSSEAATAQLLAETFAELRDEAFDEAIANLVDETEQVIADRFTGETPGNAADRERYGDAHLAPLRFEAEQYLETLEQGLAGTDLASLSEQQLDELLDRFDPAAGEVSPAGEEFIGGLIRKAKKAIKFVAKAGVIGIGGALLGPVLQRLKRLVAPLLRRVLSFAIGRLPAALQPAARALAARITGESESEADEAEESEEAEATEAEEALAVSPAQAVDPEWLAESFDAALAEALVTDSQSLAEEEAFAGGEAERPADDRTLEVLAEARGTLIDRLRDAAEDEDLGPAIEQFVPALLGALRIGIRVVGRPKVVRFLAGYLSQLIGKWVGPSLKTPLANAIVDTGLRLISLEAPAATERADEAGPSVLAATIEDTIRHLSESEDYVFEDEDLLQLATANAFNRAVATNFPSRFVRPALQQAPSIGGSFIARRPRNVRSYRKYSHVPEVELTRQIADALPSFGGVSVGARLGSAGVQFPVRVRVHIYEAATGTTIPRIARVDGALAGVGRGGAVHLHPLTVRAASLLFREPRLGVRVPGRFMRSRNRIAVGQRFYYLEPIGEPAVAMFEAPTAVAGLRSAAGAVSAPTQGWAVIDLRRSQIRAALYFSEVESQAIAAAIRGGRGGPALLNALSSAVRGLQRSVGTSNGRIRVVRELEDEEDFVGASLRRLPAFGLSRIRRRLRAWLMPHLARFARTRGEEFVRAATHPANGVTVLVTLEGVPGLDAVGGVLAGRVGLATLRRAVVGSASRAAPTATITVTPGRARS
jgi:hypothetical protein